MATAVQPLDHPSLIDLFTTVVPQAQQNRNAIARLKKVTEDYAASRSASASATEGEDLEESGEENGEDDDDDDGELDFPGTDEDGDDQDESEYEDTDGDGDAFTDESAGDESAGDDDDGDDDDDDDGSDSAQQLSFDDTETELPPSFREQQRRNANANAIRPTRRLQQKQARQPLLPLARSRQQQQQQQPQQYVQRRLAPLTPTPQGTSIFHNALEEYVNSARNNMYSGFGAESDNADGSAGTIVGKRASRESNDRAEYLLRLEQLRQTTQMQMHFTADMTSGQLYNLLERYTKMSTDNADLERVLDMISKLADAVQVINDDYNFLPMENYNVQVRTACSRTTFRYAISQLLRRYQGTGAFNPTREVMLTLMMPILFAIIHKLTLWFTRGSEGMQRIASRVSTAFRAVASMAMGSNPEPFIPADTPGVYVGGNVPPRPRNLVDSRPVMAPPPDSSDDEDDSEFVEASSEPQQPVRVPAPPVQQQQPTQPVQVHVPQQPRPVQVQVPQPQYQPQQPPPPLITGEQLMRQQMMQQAPLPPAMTQVPTQEEMHEYIQQTQQQQPPPPQRTQPMTVQIKPHVPIQVDLPLSEIGEDDDGVSLVPPPS